MPDLRQRKEDGTAVTEEFKKRVPGGKRIKRESYVLGPDVAPCDHGADPAATGGTSSDGIESTGESGRKSHTVSKGTTNMTDVSSVAGETEPRRDHNSNSSPPADFSPHAGHNNYTETGEGAKGFASGSNNSPLESAGRDDAEGDGGDG
ncbi:Hypothetical predicted protein [Lecanosticta acicola]|uniref:Uncharacterized protein n=1 Tax=Lecanosticta acicola TaxID=111012 RepID=A0AAI9EB26_9PEZI|nr:Hypothetical predicted protein [Lecanosticta acicola]